MKKLIALSVITLLYAVPSQACSPSVDYFNRPIAERMDITNFFIGTVTKVTDAEVSFTVVTPGGPAKDTRVGDTITLPRGEYGTCGSKTFVVGQTWLYNGSDISLSEATPLEPSDLQNGTDLATVKKALITRIDPTYVPVKAPVKEDLPVPGTYTATQLCGGEDPAVASQSRSYNLSISSPDAAGQYKVSINISGCKPKEECTFTQSAPAYGYGEMVLALEGQCSLIIQQLSSPQEWPRLQTGEAKVILNQPQCTVAQCTGINYMPVLKKQDLPTSP